MIRHTRIGDDAHIPDPDRVRSWRWGNASIPCNHLNMHFSFFLETELAIRAECTGLA
jgi:hypothetical protein